MVAETKFPTTNAELSELAGPTGMVRFPASFDEFWELLAEAEFNVEYFEEEIVATMSYETDLHSDIATQISYLLKEVFRGKSGFRVRNGNRPVCIPACGHAVFNPDGSVVGLPAELFEYRPGMNAELTPVLVFEVLSQNTRAHDLADKLPCYKQIPSLRQIIFVDSQRVEVSVWEKLNDNARWLETRLTAPDDSFLVEGRAVTLREVYEDTLL
ncbi:MAG: Uma2 family endonuclease [Saprospiraceae bacterium]